MLEKRVDSTILLPALASVVFGFWPPFAQLTYAEGASVSFVVIVTTFVRAAAMAVFCLCTQRKLIPDPGRVSARIETYRTDCYLDCGSHFWSNFGHRFLASDGRDLVVWN
jgi:hypothetical protein